MKEKVKVEHEKPERKKRRNGYKREEGVNEPERGKKKEKEIVFSLKERRKEEP